MTTIEQNKKVKPKLEFFDKQELDNIVDEALKILVTIGVLVENEEGQKILLDKGAVEKDGRILIPEKLVRDALESTPSKFQLYDREGNPAFEVNGDQDTCFYPGATAVNLFDVQENRRREPSVKDFAQFVRMVDDLPYYGCQGTSFLPKNIPDQVGDRYRLYLILKYSKKPIITGTFRKDGFAPMHAMLSAMQGGAAKLAEKPYALFITCPSPPLKWSDLTCQALIDCARTGVPTIPLAMPLSGATGPVTLRDTIVQNCAENFSGVVIAQAVNKGVPVVFGGAPATMDMRRGATAMGGIETAMITSGYVQVGKHLGLPTHCYLGASDSKLADYQAGMESSIQALIAALSGVNFAAGPGMLDFLLTQSFEKVLLDHDVCGMAQRLARGIDNKDTDLISLMGELVKSGSLLAHKHTMRNWRKELFVTSTLVDRESYGDWKKKGSKTSQERAYDEVIKRQDKNPSPLDAERTNELEAIIKKEMTLAGCNELPPEL